MDLLGQGYDPTQNDDLFPSPMYVAAWTGRADILRLMQEHLPEFEDPDPSKPWVDFLSKIGPGSLLGAAVRGDMDMVRLALYPPSRTISPSDDDNDNDEKEKRNKKKETVPNSMLVLGEMPGSVPVGSKLYAYIKDGMKKTRSPEIYQYLRSFLNQADERPHAKDYELAAKADAGDIVMVRHLLEIGASPANKQAHAGKPLMYAVRAWHEDVVDLLLECGANPNWRDPHRIVTPLDAAAKSGSMVMLRKLLDAGAKIKKTHTMPLWYAVKLEHTAMVELLLRKGVGSLRGTGYILEMAQEYGLESMVDLLNRGRSG
jgi:ankyrin repeat protein